MVFKIVGQEILCRSAHQLHKMLKAAADGYTLLTINSNHALNATL